MSFSFEDLMNEVRPFTKFFPLHHTENNYFKRFWALESIRLKNLDYLQVQLPFIVRENFMLYRECRRLCVETWTEGFELIMNHVINPSFEMIMKDVLDCPKMNLDVLKYLYIHHRLDIQTANSINLIRKESVKRRQADVYKWVDDWSYDLYNNLQKLYELILKKYEGDPNDDVMLETIHGGAWIISKWIFQTRKRKTNEIEPKTPPWLLNKYYGPLRYFWMRKLTLSSNKKRAKGSHGLTEEAYEKLMMKCVKMNFVIKEVMRLYIPRYCDKLVLDYCGCYNFMEKSMKKLYD
jgi:hypothetical protein